MPKRRTESTSSSSSSDWEFSDTEGSSKSSIDDPTFTLDSVEATKKKSGQPPLANGNGSSKKARNCSAVSEERNPVTSTSRARLHGELGIIVKEESEESKVEVEQSVDSPPEEMDGAQLQRELGIIVKEDSEESEVEVENPPTAPPETMARACSSTSAAQQSNPEVRRSKREPVPSNLLMISKDAEKPKKVPGPKLEEELFEGSLVMGWINAGFRCPYWPGMIRKAGAEGGGDRNYTRNQHGDIYYCVQFFQDPTTVHWRKARNLRIYDPAQPNRCTHPDPFVIAEFEKGLRIVNAASKFSVEARLTKFTLPEGGGIDDLLREINGWNGQQAAGEDSVAHKENRAASPAGRINSMNAARNDSIAHDKVGPPPPAQGNKTSITDVVAGLKKQAKFLKNKYLEKEEVIKSLTTDNSKLTTDNFKLTGELMMAKATIIKLILRLDSKHAENGKKNKLIEKLRANLEKTENDKLGYVDELQKMKLEVESLEGVFQDDMVEGSTGT